MRFIKLAGSPALAIALAAASSGALAHDVIFQAHATGVVGQITAASLVKNLLINDNGLSCKGLPTEKITSNVLNRGTVFVKAQTIATYTLGAKDHSDATARTENFELKVPGVEITAQAIAAHAHAECDRATGVESSSGGADILNLTINGNPVTVTGEPNQTIMVRDIAKVVFDEQTKWKSEFKTNAMHVYLFNASYPAHGDVIVSYARAKITCDL